MKYSVFLIDGRFPDADDISVGCVRLDELSFDDVQYLIEIAAKQNKGKGNDIVIRPCIEEGP